MNIKEAVAAALLGVRTLYMGQGQEIRDLLLEEIEKVDDKWYVTVSFMRPAASPSTFKEVFAQELPRLYKTVELDASTGEVLGMKIRTKDA